MASEKILKQKQEAVDTLATKLSEAKSIVLVDYKGISVESDTKLRSELRDENIEYNVIKNNILRRACTKAGLTELLPALVGTTALAIGEDEVAPARVIQKYVTKNKEFFNMKMGCIDGKFVGVNELKALAALPSRDTLIAQTAGTLNGIIASFARAISEVAKLRETA
ncbi:MAG: 50S ribosomal protein L10 [Oscillospiraceae bacterium]